MRARIRLMACVVALSVAPATAQTTATVTVAELFAQGYELKATPLMELLILQKAGKAYLCRFRPVPGEVSQIAKAFGGTGCAPI